MQKRLALGNKWSSVISLTLMVALGLVLVGGAIPARAEEKTKALGLKESVALVLKASPQVASAAKGVEGAVWSRRQAGSQFLPTFGLTYSGTRLDRAPAVGATYIPLPTFTITIPAHDVGTRDNWQSKITVTQPLFTGFALTTAYQMAAIGVDLAKISEVKTRLDIIFQAKQSYLNIILAKKATEVANQAYATNEAHLNDARNFYEVGMVPKNQVLQAEANLAQAALVQIKAENDVLLAKASMNTLLRRDLAADLEVEDILLYKPFANSLEECQAQALKTRPEIKAVEESVLLDQKKVRLAQADYFPTVALIGNYYWKGDDWQVNGSPFLSEYRSWDVTAALTWNFWEWGRTYDEVKAAQTVLAQAEYTLTQVKDGVTLDVKNGYISLKEAERAIVVAQKAVESAEENFRMSNERYREQVATSTEVLDALTLLTQAQTSRYQALYGYSLAWITLERAMGIGRDEI